MSMSGKKSDEHYVKFDPHGERGLTAWCICGWKRHHARKKVLDKIARKHLTQHGAL